MQSRSEEGVIKFRCRHIIAHSLPDHVLEALKHFRQLLYMQKLIGVDENGIGYGNISQRYGNSNKFIITGTQTGHLPELTSSDFTLVEEYNIAENRLTCIGPVKASSESLTHAALYSANSYINAVIHIHHAKAWNNNLNKLPTTPKSALYGTPDMAFEIMKLCTGKNSENKIVLMGGHEDGIIAFGTNLADAYQQLISTIGS